MQILPILLLLAYFTFTSLVVGSHWLSTAVVAGLAGLSALLAMFSVLTQKNALREKLLYANIVLFIGILAVPWCVWLLKGP